MFNSVMRVDKEKSCVLKKPGFSGIESSNFWLDNYLNFFCCQIYSEKKLIGKGEQYAHCKF